VWVVLGTLGVLRYAVRPLGNLLAPLAIVGAIRLGRVDGRLLVLLLAPLGLALVAALMVKYPYGGMRTTAFTAPALILCVVAGVGPTWAWLRARGRWWPWVLLVPVLAVPFVRTAYRTVVPWPRNDYRAAVAHVRDAGRPNEPIVSADWAVPYYAHRAGLSVLPFDEARGRRPKRIWVIVSSDPGVREKGLALVPEDYRPVETYEASGSVAVLYELADSTSPGGSVP
jgi:hypothetical protein